MFIFSACEMRTIDEFAALSYAEKRMAEAETAEFAYCGVLESAAYNELIKVHSDKDTIYYSIPYIPGSLDTARTKLAIQKAYEQWEEIIGISIVESTYKPKMIGNYPVVKEEDKIDIVILFDWMDGLGGILGKADFPALKAPQILTFDLYDMHEIEGELQFDFFTTALHEAGHTVGIPHLAHSDAVMWPAYRNAHTHIKQPDILAAKRRYEREETFNDFEGRKFVYVKKKTNPAYHQTSGELNSSHDVEIMMERGTSSTAH